jgi:hypothetical protein
MEFFDKKEEVMEIQLTSYGRQLLSKGMMKPAYYAFFDDGVMYDGAKGGLTEVQNDVQYRVKNETIFMKDVDDYEQADRFAKNPILIPDEFEKNVLPLMDFNSTFENQLGASRNTNNNAPAWAISCFSAEITGSNNFLTASAESRDIPIPQINIDQESIQYEVRPSSENVDQFNDLEPCEREESAFFNSEVVFGDGTTLEIKEGKILLKVEEKNTLSLKDNFEIEVFEVVDLKETPVSATNTEFLVPLKFLKEEKQIQNNLLVEPDTEILDSLDKVNNGFVSYYLDISYDADVDQVLVCRNEEKDDTTLFFKNPINCDEVLTEQRAASVYDNNLSEGGIDLFISTLDEECE